MEAAAGAPRHPPPTASSSQAVLAQEDDSADMDIDESQAPLPAPDAPPPPTLPSSAFSHASDHFMLRAGAPPLTATQSLIRAVMRKMEQTRNTAVDGLNLGVPDNEELPGDEPNADELADLLQLLENMGSAQDESFYPWPSRNVCLTQSILVTY